MMAEKDLIAKIRQLRQIKPRKDWVFSVKNQVLGPREVFPWSLFQPRMALAGIISVFVILGIFTFTKNALPGDILYSIKGMAERSRAVLVSQAELPQVNLEIANKRLADLTKIAETNQVKKLAPALKAYQASLLEATKNLVRAAATTSDPVVIKKIALETQKLEENKARLEKIYGIAGLEAEDGANPTQVLDEWLLNDLEKRTLTEEQKLLFAEAKKDYENGDYNLTLEKILKLSEN